MSEILYVYSIRWTWWYLTLEAYMIEYFGNLSDIITNMTYDIDTFKETGDQIIIWLAQRIK